MTPTMNPAAARNSNHAEALPPRVRLLFDLFTFYARRYLAKHFHAVRLDRNGVEPAALAGPLLVVLNHPGWWDPLVCQVLAPLFGPRRHFAPIDAAALPNYGFFKYLGYFGIDPRTYPGAATFLRLGSRILTEADAALWVTAQGEFTDARTRPVALRPGVGHLVRRLPRVTVLPLALEYVFWTERTPEALVRFGEPLVVHDGITPARTIRTPARRASEGSLAGASGWCDLVSCRGNNAASAVEWTRVIADELAAAQDALAEKACRRDPAAFEVLVSGQVGIGGVYDAWRRLKSVLSGRAFRPGHAE